MTKLSDYELVMKESAPRTCMWTISWFVSLWESLHSQPQERILANIVAVFEFKERETNYAHGHDEYRCHMLGGGGQRVA